MLASRLLSTLLILQRRGRVAASELAHELEVSVRTVYRDIDELSAAGIPVLADRGRSGGFRLLDGYRTDLTGMTVNEAETVLLAGLPGPTAEMGLADFMTSARLKLLAALPLGARAERVASRFHLDPAGWFRATEPAPLLPLLVRAVWDERELKLQYRRGIEVRSRVVGPLGVVLKGGIWYLVAQRGLQLRSYRVSHIVEAALLDSPFVRPAQFELDAYWTQSSRDFELGAYRASCILRLTPRGQQLIELLGPHVVDAVRASARADGEGWIRCRIPLESEDFGIREIMRLGVEAEVLGPASLRAAIAARLRAMLACYLDAGSHKRAARTRSRKRRKASIDPDGVARKQG